ncbi:Hypothetical predicted protein [Mytilus galloprovincialis]|uniref:Uncharacterized protein n=1 Tax=Mytilus galloprovincialis TaxID=29158 RepID=A0A8B6ENA5_MYTGA|nr:Hypothetical predicted protein [Mytilus galloprovincialis]
MKIVKILCAMFIMLISVLAGTASGQQLGLPHSGRLEFNRVKRDANDNFDRIGT